MTIKKKTEPPSLDRVLFVRADADLVRRIDAYADEQKKQHPGRTVSRADAVRELLHTALALS